MKWTTLLSVTASAGALTLAGCGDRDPVSSADNSDLDPASKLVVSAEFAGGELRVIPLPDGFAPEGIDIGPDMTFYVASRATGSIYRGNLRTGQGSILVPPTNSLTLGLFYEARGNRLFVCGRTGTGYVYDAATGAQLGAYPFPDARTINDVVVTNAAAYFTDSHRPHLYVVPLGPGGELPAPSAVQVLPLTGDYKFLETAPSPGSINNNGIVATADGQTLIAINMGEQKLYRIDPKTGVARGIQLNETLPPHGDGLHLEGLDLYLLLNFSNKLAHIRLSPDLNSGVVTRMSTCARFDIPTTLASAGNMLYAVNARFTTPVSPTTTYDIVRIPK